MKQTRKPRAIDLTGMRFGKLLVIGRADIKKGKLHWNTQCDCGIVSSTCGQRLREGLTTSCGCFGKDNLKNGLRLAHGQAKRGSATPEYLLFTSAKRRAKDKCLEFDLELEDIIIPEKCPVFNVDFVFGKKSAHKYSPTIDRIDNAKGYVKGNIWVISYRANELKRNGTINEIVLLAGGLLDKTMHDRDLNSAINILRLGQQSLAGGSPVL